MSNWVKVIDVIEAISKLPNIVTDENMHVYGAFNWESEYESLVRSLGTITYGKERWFNQGNGMWYDREEEDYINLCDLERRVCKAVSREIGDEE